MGSNVKNTHPVDHFFFESSFLALARKKINWKEETTSYKQSSLVTESNF